MTKFQKIQKASSVIPYISSVFVFFITMIELKRQKASVKKWLIFYLIFFLSGTTVYFLNSVIMTGKNPVLNFIVCGLVFALANILCVDLQIYGQKPNSQEFMIEVIILIALAGFTILISMLRLALRPTVDIEDTNGDINTNVVSIQVDDVLNTKNKYSAFSINTKRTGNQTNASQDFSDYDFDECSYQCKKMNGILTLQVTKSNQDKLSLHIDSELTKGNLEIFILVDGVLFDRIPANTPTSLTIDGVAAKTVIVRLAAESAAFSVAVNREFE